MHTKVELLQFHINAFLQEHSEALVVVVNGSWYYDTHTGDYAYQTRLGERRSSTRIGQLTNSSSSNHAMLEGVLAAFMRIQMCEKDVYVLSPTPLGFKKCKGPNEEIINKIFRISEEKKLNFHSIAISNGGKLIRDILDNKI